MFSQPIAARMVAESTRRALSEPQRLVRPAGPRRAIALVLQSAAHRLDPYAAASRPDHARALSPPAAPTWTRGDTR